jgi:hypothetical protein
LAPRRLCSPPCYRLDDWKGHVHLVAKASLLPSIRGSLYLRLPEDVIPPDRRLDLAMVRGTSLVTVSDELRAVLLEKGVRVWTVGYTHHSSLFRLLAVGGGEPLLWIQQDLGEFFGMYSGIELVPVLPARRSAGRRVERPIPARRVPVYLVEGPCCIA